MLNFCLHILLIHIMNVISWYFLRVAHGELLIHSAALNNKYSMASSGCFVGCFCLHCGHEGVWKEMDRGAQGVEGEEGWKYCKTTKSYFFLHKQ